MGNSPKTGWLTRPGTLRSPRSAASAGCLTPSTCLRSPAACSGSPASIDARRSPLWTDTAHRRAPSTTVGGSPSTSRSTPTCDPHQRDNRMGPHGTMADPDQVEQDLLLSQLICLIAGDDYLGDELVFRGGTCLHKLYLH